MAIINVISRTPNSEGEWEYNEGVEDIDFPKEEWIHSPDISFVRGLDQSEWKWNGISVVPKTESEVSFDADNYEGYTFENSGRVYCYGDDRWICGSDDLYGINYFQWLESSGTNVDPIFEWEHQGHLVRKGDILKSIQMYGRSNSITVEEVEILFAYRQAIPTKTFRLSGIDADADMTTTEILRENWKNPLDINLMGENFDVTNDSNMRFIDRSFVIPEDGFITPYYGPTNVDANGALRYFYTTYRLDMLRERT